MRAARALSDIGVDLARTGTSITAAADPDKLSVVDGRLPLDAVRALTPELQRGSDALDRALTRLEDVRNDSYLAPPVRDAVDKVGTELTRAHEKKPTTRPLRLRSHLPCSGARAIAPTC